MLPRSFYFLRHGETDWNKVGRLQGFTDIPLNETGRAQARDVVRVLERHPIDRIVASPLSRARETADIINTVLKKPIIEEQGLRERHFGIFEGKDTVEIDALKARMLTDKLEAEENGYPCPPEAETYVDFKARTLMHIEKHLNTYVGENIMFVCHGGLYRVLLRALFGEAGSSLNVQPFLFEKTADNWALHHLNDNT